MVKLRWFQLFGTSWVSISNFLEKNQIFGFPCWLLKDSWRPLHWCMYQLPMYDWVWLTLMKLRWFQLFSTSQNSISNFFEKKIKLLSFCIEEGTHEDLSIDVSITNVELTLIAKAKVISALQYKLKSKSKFNIELWWKNWVSNFPCCSYLTNIREDLSIDVLITNVGLILTKQGWFIFSGCRQSKFNFKH